MEKMLIAVHSDMFADALTAALHKDYEIRACTDGVDALALLNTFKPDALIVYLRLPRMDALTVLSRSAHIPKIIIGILDTTNPYIEQQAQKAGIQHLAYLPTISTLTTQLTQMRLEYTEKKKDPQLETVLHLHTLSMDASMAGWDMLRVGVPMLAADTKQTLSKELYPAIAVAVDASDGRSVEHAIRDFIAKAWRRRDHFVWLKYFPPDKDGNIPCPTNSLFIKTLARMISL